MYVRLCEILLWLLKLYMHDLEVRLDGVRNGKCAS
jgi:hypothetical protein